MPRDYDDDEPRPRRRPRRDDDDDDDRPPPRRKVRRYVDDDEDEPRPRRKKSRPKQKQMNAVGAIALGIGVISLLISFIPCFASIALWPGIVGVVVGFIGLLISHNSDGRLGNGMPIAGMSVSTAAILIGVGWLVLGKKVEKEIERRGKDFQAEVAKEEAKRKDEVARAAKDVKDADPATVIRLTAFQFSKAFEDDGQGDRLYKNKVLEITGVVQRVDFGDDEDAYIVLLRAGPNEEDAVDCRFLKDPAVRAQLGQIQPGATVTIRGKCLGGDASLEACILVQ